MYQRPNPTFTPSEMQSAPEPATTPEAVAAEPAPMGAPSSPTPSVARHLYTLTVDQALSELYAHQLYRDVRTVQRWCKSGKLRAIVDEANGDRYLIDPASLRELTATLLQERAATTSRVAPVPRPESRPRPDDVWTPSRHEDDAAATAHSGQQAQSDSQTHAATQATASQSTSAAGRDEVAALLERVAALEREKTMLEVDKRVREQLVDYLKEQFGSMLDQALTRTEEIGALRAENRQLRELLPAPRQEIYRPEPNPPQPGTTGPRFSPSSVAGEGDNTLHRHTPWSSDDHV